MKKWILIYIPLMLASCTAHHMAKTPLPKLIPLDDFTKGSISHEVSMHYTKHQYDLYEFEVFIRNKSKDSISVDPSSFSYNSLSEKTEIDTKSIYSINPQEKIRQLEMQRDSLKDEWMISSG
ncbi:hypothetical protein QQ008_09900 [Fulvivirgaceae bacterium BMA10]|uniref:Lipoprotein n=1 Tax=Splendidivirga corallicola TaxID=3051826 RepID=A0ABT8KNR1_9BACT|nr:hypothetical protein [Fulvivirgaceae bacterium BMA10]